MKFLTGPLRTVLVVLLAIATGYGLTMIAINVLITLGMPSGLEVMLIWFLATLASAFLWQKLLPSPARANTK